MPIITRCDDDNSAGVCSRSARWRPATLRSTLIRDSRRCPVRPVAPVVTGRAYWGRQTAARPSGPAGRQHHRCRRRRAFLRGVPTGDGVCRLGVARLFRLDIPASRAVVLTRRDAQLPRRVAPGARPARQPGTRCGRRRSPHPHRGPRHARLRPPCAPPRSRPPTDHQSLISSVGLPKVKAGCRVRAAADRAGRAELLGSPSTYTSPEALMFSLCGREIRLNTSSSISHSAPRIESTAESRLAGPAGSPQSCHLAARRASCVRPRSHQRDTHQRI